MATEASKSRSVYAPVYPTSYPYTHYVYFKETSTDTTNNTSSLTFTASMTSNGAGFGSATDNWLSVYWFDDGANSKGTRVAITSTKAMEIGGNLTVSGTLTVTHKNDGTLSGYALSYWTSDGTNNPPSNSTVQTGATSLTNIPRGSSITLDKTSVLVDGTNSIRITIGRAVSTYTDTLTYSIGNVNGTIVNNTTKTTIDWVVPVEVLNAIPYATSGTVTISCRTYKGSTALGTSTATFTAVTDHEVHGPSLTITRIYDAKANDQYGQYTLNDITGGAFISNVSEIHVIVEAEGRYGTTRRRTEATLNDQTAKAQINEQGEIEMILTGDFGDGDQDLFVSTRDNRGYTTTIPVRVHTVGYYPPVITQSAADRSTEADASETVVGTTSGTWYNASLGAMNNTLSVSVYYTNPDTGPTALPSSVVGDGTWSYTGELFNGLADTKSSTVRFVISDLLTTVRSQAISVYEYLPVFAMFKDHFDVFGDIHIHRRDDPNCFSVLTYDAYNSFRNEFIAGDVYAFTGNVATFSGFLTTNASGNNVIAFSIPLPYHIGSGLVAAVAGDITVRHASGGYIGTPNQNIGNLGTSEVDYDANFVRVRITLAGTVSYANNSVVCVTPGNSLSITFSAAA